jgi:hypothetical protein
MPAPSLSFPRKRESRHPPIFVPLPASAVPTTSVVNPLCPPFLLRRIFDLGGRLGNAEGLRPSARPWGYVRHRRIQCGVGQGECRTHHHRSMSFPRKRESRRSQPDLCSPNASSSLVNPLCTPMTPSPSTGEGWGEGELLNKKERPARTSLGWPSRTIVRYFYPFSQGIMARSSLPTTSMG